MNYKKTDSAPIQLSLPFPAIHGGDGRMIAFADDVAEQQIAVSFDGTGVRMSSRHSSPG
jgi:hypothetical protein